MKNATSTQVERSFRKWRRVSSTDGFFFTVQTLIKIEIFRSRPLHRRSIHAEFKPLHRLNEVSKMAERLLHGRFCSLSILWFKIEILSIPSSTLGGVFMLSSKHRLNEVSKKWRSVSFTDAFVHCPDFGSKSKFFDPGRTP
ncbi:hypothetical protein TNCV_3835181 [Trichonephila clavipes]|nr:hypothetical protein TNCV_3835181 [Trichonephila clavipes]